MKLIYWMTILLLLIFNSCNAQDKDKVITIDELTAAMEKDSSTIILDVRTAPELSGPLGHIDGVIHIPLQELDKRVDELDEFKNKQINVICRTGRRSGIAASILNEKGFKAKNVLGGMKEYREKGN
ncbi:MAG: rhodanese-like domain-containing protein [Ignavibacteriae bacterium]|nr:rhodanese-like domain-containing protein [Ignavibacteriota bacterium]NOG96857.1 rhodanese-like domain-containing protein [Ignavibacteriota bacterium]